MKKLTIPRWFFVLTCVVLVAMFALGVYGIVSLLADPAGTMRALSGARVK